MPQHQTPDLDQIIDAVTRRVTAVEPAANLRARILSRLDATTQPRWTWKLVPALGAVAGVAIAVFLFAYRPATTVPQIVTPAVVAPQQMAAATPSQVAAPATASPAPRAAKSAAKPAQRRLATSAAPSAEELAWRSRAIPALDQIKALTLDAIQPAALAIPLLELKPIATTPLVTPPLGDDKR